MLRSCPRDFNLLHYIIRDAGIVNGRVDFRKREIPVMYRYSMPTGVVKGKIVGTLPGCELVQVRFDDGTMIQRHPSSFDLIDRTGKMADVILEYFK